MLMSRYRLVRLFLPAALVFFGAAPAWAAAATSAAWRGPGDYLSPAKVITCLLMLVLWIRAADWINRDSQKLHLDHVMWNFLGLGTFFAAAGLFWLLPWFWLGLVLLLIAVAGPLTGYLVYRHPKVADRHEEALDSVLDLAGRFTADAVSVAAFFGVMLVAGLITSAAAAASGTTVFLIRLLAGTAFVVVVVPLYHEGLCNLVAGGFGRLASLEKADPNVQGGAAERFRPRRPRRPHRRRPPAGRPAIARSPRGAGNPRRGRGEPGRRRDAGLRRRDRRRPPPHRRRLAPPGKPRPQRRRRRPGGAEDPLRPESQRPSEAPGRPLRRRVRRPQAGGLRQGPPRPRGLQGEGQHRVD